MHPVQLLDEVQVLHPDPHVMVQSAGEAVLRPKPWLQVAHEIGAVLPLQLAQFPDGVPAVAPLAVLTAQGQMTVVIWRIARRVMAITFIV